MFHQSIEENKVELEPDSRFLTSNEVLTDTGIIYIPEASNQWYISAEIGSIYYLTM